MDSTIEAIQLLGGMVSSAVDSFEGWKEDIKFSTVSKQSADDALLCAMNKLTEELHGFRSDFKDMFSAHTSAIHKVETAIDRLTTELAHSNLSRLEDSVTAFATSVTTLAKL